MTTPGIRILRGPPQAGVAEGDVVAVDDDAFVYCRSPGHDVCNIWWLRWPRSAQPCDRRTIGGRWDAGPRTFKVASWELELLEDVPLDATVKQIGGLRCFRPTRSVEMSVSEGEVVELESWWLAWDWQDRLVDVCVTQIGNRNAPQIHSAPHVGGVDVRWLLEEGAGDGGVIDDGIARSIADMAGMVRGQQAVIGYDGDVGGPPNARLYHLNVDAALQHFAQLLRRPYADVKARFNVTLGAGREAVGAFVSSFDPKGRAAHDALVEELMLVKP